jgi:hypothetical protein
MIYRDDESFERVPAIVLQKAEVNGFGRVAHDKPIFSADSSWASLTRPK